jgi:hypothetical protein
MACIASSVSGLCAPSIRVSGKAAKTEIFGTPVKAKALGAGKSAMMASTSASRGMSVVAMSNPRGNSGGSRKGLHKYVERVDAPQLKVPTNPRLKPYTQTLKRIQPSKPEDPSLEPALKTLEPLKPRSLNPYP